MDIRQPMGWFFLTIGMLLAGYGLLAHPAALAQAGRTGIDVGWGGFLAHFGALMLALARRHRRRAAA
jgi:hypothetical protein